MRSADQLSRWLLTTAAVALLYAALGWLGQMLTLSPGYAPMLAPAAGLALAALICQGARLAPGVALGAFALNALLGQHRGQAWLLASALIGAGAALQALAGAWAIRRFVSWPLLLSEPLDLLRFYGLGAILACVIGASFASGGLWLTGSLQPQQLAPHWVAWWMGEVLGVLIGAPIALTLYARPREAWAPRRLSVGLPLLLACLLMVMVTLRISASEEQRERSRFERDADSALGAAETALREPLGALEAVRDMLLVAPELGRTDFERATAAHLLPGGNLLALGWAGQVQRQEATTMELAARAEGLTGFTVRDRQRPGDHRPDEAEPMLVIRLIEPMVRNAPALGINIRSIPASREALLRAARTALPTATAGFQLTQDSEASLGVVIYQALYAGNPGTAAERSAALRGVAFATIRPDLLMQAIAATVPAQLALCLVDTDPLAAHRRLAGPPGCESLPGDTPVRLRSLHYAGRSWDIKAYASDGALAVGKHSSGAFGLVGLLSTALLGMLLLTITGRARRIEALVQARTAELQHEIRQREQASQALAQSEQRFRNIFDHVPIGLVFTDLDGIPREANPQFCSMLGYSAETLAGMSSLDFTHPDDRDEGLRLKDQLIAGKINLYRRQKRYLTREGQVVQVRAMVTLLRDSSGAPHSLLGVVEDITDQLKMRELEQAREAAEAANRAKNEFLSRMSHELRTPLNAMLGFTQLLEMDTQQPLSPRQQGWAAQVQHAGWHLLEMINDILDLSRIESDALKLELTPQDLQPLLDGALSMVEKSAAQRGLRISHSLDPSARHALGDATRIKQVLTNLLSNAVKYNLEGGQIHISSRRIDAGMLEIAVTDTGLGLSQQQLDQLFQPFNRLGREASSTEGTGIGLVISKRLAELMGGSLQVSSTAAKGSCFALQLPLAPPGTAARAKTTDLATQALLATPRRIVYIEDKATNVEVMRGILAQRPQLQLEVYVDGASGLAAVLERPPDLLLLDMQLPDTDGLSLLQALRQAPQCAALPVVAVSANAMPDQIARSQAAGLQHYLTKPVDVKQLWAVLDQLLGTS